MLPTWTYIAAGAALLLLGKDAPLSVALSKLTKLKLPITPGPPAPTPSPTPTDPAPTPIDSMPEHPAPAPTPSPRHRLPEWIREPNDLQQMLLYLGRTAALAGNDELKDATFALMQPYADLQIERVATTD